MGGGMNMLEGWLVVCLLACLLACSVKEGFVLGLVMLYSVG